MRSTIPVLVKPVDYIVVDPKYSIVRRSVNHQVSTWPPVNRSELTIANRQVHDYMIHPIFYFFFIFHSVRSWIAFMTLGDSVLSTSEYIGVKHVYASWLSPR